MPDETYAVERTSQNVSSQTGRSRSALSMQGQDASRFPLVLKAAMILRLSLLGWGCAKPQLPQSQLVVKPFC